MPSRNGEAPAVEVILHKLESGHWYEAISSETRQRIKWLTSVTRYTKEAPKPGLMKWMAEKGPAEAERIKIEGGIRGNAVHRAQEMLANGRPVYLKDYSREVAEHILAYRNWYEDFDPMFVSTEEIVYNLDEGVGGTSDLRYVLGEKSCEKLKIDPKHIDPDVGGIHVINDLKTSKALYEENFLQVNKYAHMRNDMGIDPGVGVPVEWISLLRTNSKHKRKYEFVIEPLCQKRLEVFNCLKRVVDHFDPQTEPYFPKPLPEVVQLYEAEPSRNGHARNGRPR